jgi:hypothetical protein
MKSGILGVLLATAAAGGVTFLFVGSGKHCGPCLKSQLESSQTSLTIDATPCSDTDGPECKACQSGSAGKVYDVVDLKVGYQINGEPAPFVSFDEPPLAKRPAGVQRVGYEAKADGPEVLPPPRQVQ